MKKQEEKTGRKEARPYPRFSLEKSLVLARAIQDKNAGKPMNRLLLAEAIGRKHGSSDYEGLLSSSNKYGLTLGNEKSANISLTPLGERVTKPIDAAEKTKALREAALKPDLFKKVFEHYDNAKLPSGTFFQNTLERQFGVPTGHAAECELRLLEDGGFVGIIREISGSPSVILGMVEAGKEEPEAGEEAGEERKKLEDEVPPPPPPPPPAKPKQLFIGHGKNKVPLEQLKGILNGFKVPFKVAVDEPYSGRPISEKVAETMKECTSGIFIFTGDEEVYDKEGKPVLRPGGNVIYELGAASVLYGKNIVIFKEAGIDFPTDFRDIGHIPFEKDNLDAKASELFKELISFGILKVSVA